MVVSAGQPLVAAPTRTPLSYGLLSVSQTPVDTDEHWQLGVRFEPDTCEPDEMTFEVCPVTGSPEVKTPTGSWSTRAANPVTVYAYLACNPVGVWDDYEDRLTRAFNAGEARAIEREFWTGEAGLLPHLAEDTPVFGTGFDSTIVLQTAATVVTGAPGIVDIVEGVALLEQALATCYGSEGVLHVPPIAVAHLVSKTLVEKDGPRLRSPMGHLVAAGAGYPGTSPTGEQVGGVYWLYATGALAVRRSALRVTSPKQAALDRSTNSMVFVAERTYVIGWDCCHFAVPVSMGGEASGVIGGAT